MLSSVKFYPGVLVKILKKTCSKCKQTLSAKDFHRDTSQGDGLRSRCKPCRAEEPSPEKKHPLEEVRDAVSVLVQGERVDMRRSLARSVSLAVAREQIFIDDMRSVAALFKDRIAPVGYARHKSQDVSRSACLFLSDLHLGSQLSALDNPTPFGGLEESRRLESILRRYLAKSDGRKEAVLLLGGDLIEGCLGHDQRDGLPLAEQQYVFWSYLSRFVGYVAAEYPKVRVVCQAGNHGRNKLRHHGRATSSKWDSFEWAMYRALEMMCSSLKNVTFDIPFRAVSLVNIQGSKLLFTHGDTEIKLGDPDTQAKSNQMHLLTLRESGEIEGHFDGACFGHYHKARYQVARVPCLFNGALVPPNGYARTEGYLGECCGQWYFESERGSLFSSVEFFAVGKDQDSDSSLGDLIPSVRF